MKDYKDILRRNSLSGKDISGLLGISYGSYRSALSKGIPRWVKSFMIGYGLGVAEKNKDNE